MSVGLDTPRSVPYLGHVPKSRNRTANAEITVREAAEILGVDRKTVLRFIASERITPTRKLPLATGAYLLPLDDVERLAVERAS